MAIADIQPDIALKSLLKGKVMALDEDGNKLTLKVFADGEHGNMDTDDEYIEILYNGNPNDVTLDMESWNGNLALYLRCRLQSDTKIKTNRMRSMLRQIEPLIHRKHAKGYFFKFTSNPITPPQRDYSTNYAYTAYNIEWRVDTLSQTNN